MNAIRPFVIALSLIAAGFACRSSATGLREPAAAASAARDSSGAPAAVAPSFDRRTGNYAVAW